MKKLLRPGWQDLYRYARPQSSFFIFIMLVKCSRLTREPFAPDDDLKSHPASARCLSEGSPGFSPVLV